MTSLPIRALTLYKQGIGYYERRGKIDGGEVVLTIPRSGTNDALKSLDISIYQGGPVSSVDYETPTDTAQMLAGMPIKLADRSSLVDLLTSLRGSTLALQLDEGTSIEGRLIGVETSIDSERQAPAVLIQLESSVQVVPLSQIQSLILRDEQAARDVAFFLDVSRIEQTRTTLAVRLPAGEHELGIRYLAPSPTWRVSYRLVIGASGDARLLGWGVFDNNLDEDLENVTLTLLSGRPISFEYELYEPRIPTRPQVSDDPTSLEAMAGSPLLAESLSTISHELRTPLTSIAGYAALLEREALGALTEQQRAMVRNLRQQVERMTSLINNLLSLVRLRDDTSEPPTVFFRSGPLGDLKVSGSYFMPVLMGNAEPENLTYHVATPISVRRGQSAMVPIIDAAVGSELLCIYNGAKMPNHPLLVRRLQNTAGVALEQGPVTIVEAGQYRGEGLMRFTGVGDDIQIPYALEFGVLIQQEMKLEPERLERITFDSATRKAQMNWAHITAHQYTLTSHINRDITVSIEHRDPNAGEYFEMPAPELAVSSHTRWPVMLAANGVATFTVRERTLATTAEDVTAWDAERVDDLRDLGLLHDSVYALLRRLLETLQAGTMAAQQQIVLQTEYQQIGVRQEQLRKNLGALGASERETQIRNRLLDDLETSEDRRRAIELTLGDLARQAEQRQIDQRTLLDEIFQPTAP